MIRWESIARDLNFPGEKEMWDTLYRKFSIPQLAMRFAVSTNTIRKELHKHGIEVRRQGGANNQKIVLTPELIEEIKAKGVLAIARDQGLDFTTIYKLLKKAGINVKELRSSGQASPQATSEHPDAEGPEDHDESQ